MIPDDLDHLDIADLIERAADPDEIDLDEITPAPAKPAKPQARRQRPSGTPPHRHRS